MSSEKREDSTSQLIAEGEALRSNEAAGKRTPRTRQLVRDAERLIGRQPPAPGVKKLLGWAAGLAILAVVLAVLYLWLA